MLSFLFPLLYWDDVHWEFLFFYAVFQLKNNHNVQSNEDTQQIKAKLKLEDGGPRLNKVKLQ